MPTASSVTHVKSRWENGVQLFYVKSTLETVHVNAPFYFYDDFVGHAGLEVGDTSETWDVVDVSPVDDTTPAVLPGTAASGATGVVELKMDVTTNEGQDSGIYWGDQTPVSVYNDTSFECRLAMHTVPGAATTAVFGMCGAHNLDKDTVAEKAWFRLQGSAVLLTESEDTTNTNEDVATGITLVADEYHIFRISFGNLADVRFYVDGLRVSAGTTFDMTNLTAAEAMFQPYLMLDHAVAQNAGSLYIDYVRVWSTRTSYRDDV